MSIENNLANCIRRSGPGSKNPRDTLKDFIGEAAMAMATGAGLPQRGIFFKPASKSAICFGLVGVCFRWTITLCQTMGLSTNF